MSKYMTKFNAANLLEKLSSEGFINDNQELGNFIINRQQQKELPLYLRILIGIGAFIASACFIAFLKAANIINYEDERGMMIWGLVFVTAALGLQKIAGGDNNTVRHNFFVQSSFSMMVIGKLLFVFGVSQMMDSTWGITIALCIITSITYHIYPVSIDRFLSSFALLISVWANIIWKEEINSSNELLPNGFFLFQFIGTAILLMHRKIKDDYIPLSYAFSFSLCISLLFCASKVEIGHWKYKELIHPGFINILLIGGLISVFCWAAGGITKLKREPLILASISAMLLGFISVPGVLLAIGLMVIGYAKHDKLLIITGALVMPIFLFIYYYNLDISLLHKAGVLIGSGAILLLGKFYLKYKGWDDGGELCVQK